MVSFFLVQRKKIIPAVFFFLSICGPLPLHAEPQLPVESPLAMVNGVVLSNGELESEIRFVETELDYRNRPLSDHRLHKLAPQITELLIERELLYQQARKRNLKVRRRWIERAVDELKTRLGSTSSFNRYLKDAQSTEEDLRKRIERGLIIRRLLHREVLREIKISESEMQFFYQKHPEFFMNPPRVRARHIMVAVPADATEEQRTAALAQIQQIQKKLQQGSAFSVLALEYSDGPSKYRGGDLGFFSHNEVLSPIAEAAFSMQPGEISDIITTRHGLHLVQTIEQKPSSQMAYKNTRDKIERTLRRNKEKAAVDAYLAKLKKKAVITRQN